MAIAVDRVNTGHIHRLRHIKGLREERALKEWQALRSQHEGLVAEERSCRDLLESIYDERDACNRDFACFLVASDVVAEHHVTHHRIRMEAFDTRAQHRRGLLDDVRRRRKEIEAALAQGRALWLKATAATRKWDLIKTDVAQTKNSREEILTEIESEDDARRGSSVARGRGSVSQA